MAFVRIEDLNGSAEIIVFEPTYLKAQDKIIEDNIIIIKGRLSIREDDETKIVAQDIKNFGESFEDVPKKKNQVNIAKPKRLVLDITNSTDEQKEKLRGAIRFFNGEKNNIALSIKVGEELRPCGAIYLTEEILKEFEEIVEKENCILTSI